MTSLPSLGDPSALYLVDLPALLHRHYHGRPPTLVRGERVEAVQGVLSDIRRIVSERRPAYLAVAVESPRDDDPATWRHELYPAYKSARPPKPLDLVDQERRAREVIEALGIPVLAAPGFEADDAIAAATARAVAAGLRVVVVARDKDLLQLVGERVCLWDIQRDRTFDVAGVSGEWTVPPEQLGDLLALAGDASDGIPGVPGIGPAKASALLRAHKRLERLLRNAGGVRGKVGESLRAHAAQAVLSRKLVTLRADAPIRWAPDAMRLGGGSPELARHLLERAGVGTAGLTWGPKTHAPLEVIERSAAWDGAEAERAIAAAWTELEEAIGER